jgi:hypothetical protein
LRSTAVSQRAQFPALIRPPAQIMKNRLSSTAIPSFFLLLILVFATGTATAQRFGGGPTGPDFPVDDPVLKAIWEEGMDNSSVYELSQYMADVLGPRLTGSPGYNASAEWAAEQMRSWGIDAGLEEYGTWRSWQRGVSHVDLVEPRVRSLEGQLLGWSVGTDGPVEGGVTMLPEGDFQAWLPSVKGKFVLMSYAEPSCRPASSWEEHGPRGAVEAFNEARSNARSAWNERIEAIGMERQDVINAIEDAGALGFITNYWTGQWGIERIFPMTYSFRAMNREAAAFNLSCEDYGLVFRLTENGQGPVLRANAEAEDLGEQPVFNVVGTIPGTELPDEYVLLSAHFDSWDGASGVTDNGTGSVVMLETMRILKKVYPNPKRTIVIGLWGGEEQGLNGSRAFSADHPEIVDGLQVLLNQDNGTGRIARISTQGLVGAGEHFARWFSSIPNILVGDIDLNVPGNPGSGGSDYASFICAGAPAFSLSATSYDYGSATWHTNRDTFDKIAWQDLMGNATLTAYLTYLASEGERISREQRDLGIDPRTDEARAWPSCQLPARETTERFR